jgi:hypothetical protein
MPKMILDPIRATLVDLRARFVEQSKQHRSLYHVLVVASPTLQSRFTMRVNSGPFFVNMWFCAFICKSYLGAYLPSLGSYYTLRGH